MTTAAQRHSATGTQQEALHEAVGGPAGAGGSGLTVQALGMMSVIAMLVGAT